MWENLGWHWNVISPCRRIKVHPFNDRGPYNAFLGAPGEPGGYWAEDARTPEAAVRKVVKVAKAWLARFSAYVEGL